MSEHRQQIKEAKKGNAILFGSNREIRRLPIHLHDGEIVHSIISGSPGPKRGRAIVVCTNERVLFIRDGWVFRNIQDFPYDTISSVEFKTGIFFGTFIMYGLGDDTAYNWVGRFAGAKFAKTVRKLLSDSTRARNTNTASIRLPSSLPPLPSQPLSKEENIIKQLEDLGRLRDQGIISIDDFELKKQELLSRF